MTVGDSLGHYTITRKLGAGGMGEVYAAHDTQLDREVAIKILPPRLAAEPDRIRRFEREARAVAALDHPNIVTVFSIERDQGIHFITMQLVEGRPLSQVIPARGLPLDRFFALAIPIADAVATAHQHGIVHRDLKPANIVLNPQERPFVLDFGLAKLLQADPSPEADTARVVGSSTEVGIIMGSAAYMSPEQAQGKPVDHRTDIFSLGIILYEMATGQRPFKGATRLAILSSIVSEAPVPVSDIHPGLPQQLVRVIKLALEKDPARRFQSAADVRLELEDLRQEVESGEAQPAVRRRKPTTRWRGIKLAVAAGLASIVAVVGLSTLTGVAALPFDERDWILVTDFENLTGDEVFDRSLQTALTVSIAQSSYVNVLPRQRIEGALERMQRDDVETIDETIGREIAEREAVGLLLVPSISGVGDSYLLSSLIQDARTGETLRAESVRVEDRAGVLDALDTLARRVREDLGEGLESIDAHGRKLADVTTASLDALRQYSLGTDYLARSRFGEAVTSYRHALDLDPNFIAAKASLGMLQIDSARKGLSGFDPDEGKRLLAEAVSGIDGVTDRERFSILAFHAWAVEGDVRAAEEYYKAGIALYPDLGAYHNNLGWLFQNTGRFEEAVAAYREAIRVDPYLMLTYNALTFLYTTQLGDLDEAIRIARRQLAYDEESAGAYDGLGWALLGKGDYAGARDAFAKAVSINPRAEVDWYRLAHTHRLMGDLDAAIDALDHLATVNPDDGWVLYHQGVVYQLMGDTDRARERLEQFKLIPERWLDESPESVFAHTAVGLARARLGDTAGARSALERAMTLDASAHFSHAQIFAVLGMNDDALDHLEAAVASGFRDLVWMKVHPDFISLYDEPRFEDLARRGRQ